MSTFAFHRYNSKSIYQVPANTQAAPTEICKSEVPIESLSYAEDGGFYIIDRVASKTIWRHNPQGGEFALYQHYNWIRTVRKRRVNHQERIYFLAFRDTTTAEIFYLSSGNIAVSYYLVHSNLFTFPDPCSPGNETNWEQPPDQFAFDSNNNLYLILQNTTPSGIWKVSGAGADYVTGSISRIYSATEPLDGLCCDGTKLYFHRDGTMIYSFDPNSLVETPFFDTAAIPAPDSLWDIACQPDLLGAPPAPPKYGIIKIFKKFWEWVAPHK